MATEPQNTPPETTVSAPKRKFPLILRILSLFGMIAVAATGLGLFCDSFWIADLAAQLRVQYVLLLIPAFVPWGIRRSYWRIVLAAAALILNLWPMVPYFIAKPVVANKSDFSASDDRKTLRLLIFNVLRTNTEIETTLEETLRAEADFVYLMEVAPIWQAKLETLKDRYPFQKLICRDDYTGVAFLSRHPWESLEIVDTDDANPPLDLQFPALSGQSTGFRLIVTHPLPPLGSDLTEARDRQLITLARRLSPNEPCLMTGDFNLTPWSSRFAKILAAGQLRDAFLGFGIQPTLTPFPTLIGGLKVDHVLVNKAVSIHNVRIGTSRYSDHAPVLVEFEIAGGTEKYNRSKVKF